MNHTYETLFICPGDILQEKVESAVEKVKTIISKAEGTISTSELWGRRKLAYPIEKHRDGFYVYMMFNADAKLPGMLNHHYRVTDSILRGLTIKLDPRHVSKVQLANKNAAAAQAASEKAVETTAQTQTGELAAPVVAPAELPVEKKS